MNAVINILPSVLFLLAIIPFLMIKMDNKKAAKNTKILLERNQEKMQKRTVQILKSNNNIAQLYLL